MSNPKSRTIKKILTPSLIFIGFNSLPGIEDSNIGRWKLDRNNKELVKQQTHVQQTKKNKNKAKSAAAGRNQTAMNVKQTTPWEELVKNLSFVNLSAKEGKGDFFSKLYSEVWSETNVSFKKMSPKYLKSKPVQYLDKAA